MFDLAFPWFSSDASRLAVWGGLAALLAVLANWRDRRHSKRSNLEAVGWMPWTPVYLLAALATVVFLALAAREWLAPT